MECKALNYSTLTSVFNVVFQVQMGILPIGSATTLLPIQSPPISEKITRYPRRNLRKDVEGNQ